MPTPPTGPRLQIAAAALLIVWFAVLASAYHGAFPAGTLPGHAVTLLLAAVVLADAAALGTLLLRFLAPGPVPAPLSWVLALGLGLGCLEIIVLGLLAAGAANAATGWIVLGGGAVAAAACLREWRDGAPAALASWREAAAPWWARLALALCGAAWLTALVAALAPAEFYDALVYHLAVPDLWVARGRIGAVEGNFYAHFPANQGMLYALGILLARDRIAAGALAQVLHLACGAAAAAATFAAGARHLSPKAGLLGGCLFAAVPGVLLAATHPIADLGAALDGALVIAVLLEARGAGDPRARRRWIVLAGALAGLALGVKYTTALTVLLPAAALLAWEARRLARGRPADLAAFSAAALVIFSPWAVRNVAVAGNPVAPYLAVVFGSPASGPSLTEEIERRLPEERGAAAAFRHLLGSPWRASVERLGAAGYLGPAFALLIPLALLGRPQPPAAAALAILLASALAGWAAGVQLTRYLFPALPAAALLAAHGAACFARAAPAAREGLACALGWVLGHNAYLFGVLVATVSPFGVVAGIEPVEEYLARRVEYYPAAAFINESLPATSKIFLVGEGRGYYLERGYAASTPLDRVLLGSYAERAAREATTLPALLRREGFTHVLVSRREMDRVARMNGRAEYFGAEAPAAREAILAFFSGGDLRAVFERGGVAVMEILPDRGGRPPDPGAPAGGAGSSAVGSAGGG